MPNPTTHAQARALKALEHLAQLAYALGCSPRDVAEVVGLNLEPGRPSLQLGTLTPERQAVELARMRAALERMMAKPPPKTSWRDWLGGGGEE